MVKAVIFDLDGTIADTIGAICEGVNLTMQKYGYPPHTESRVQSFINNGARELIRRAMPKELQTDEDLVTRVLADYTSDYASVCLHTDRTYDGIVELVEALRSRFGVKIAVLTNKPDALARMLIEQLLPMGRCDVTQGVIPDRPTKPDPYLSNRVMAEMGVQPDECVMIGDSDVDIRTAALAGMRHVGVSWGYRDEVFLRGHGATCVVHHPSEVIQVIQDMNLNENNVKGSFKNDQD